MGRAILLTLVLLAVVAGGFSVWFVHDINSAPDHARSTRAALAFLEQKIRLYEVDTGVLPSTLPALVVDDGTPHWNGPYVDRAELFDSLARPIKYEVIDKQHARFRLSIVSRFGYEEAFIISQ